MDVEKLMVTKGDRFRERDGLGVWDGNVLNLGCDDSGTTINIIKFTGLKKTTRSDKRIQQSSIED